jgi:hypothetical protein
MQLGGLAGLTALTMGIGQDKAVRELEPASTSNGNGKAVAVVTGIKNDSTVEAVPA